MALRQEVEKNGWRGKRIKTRVCVSPSVSNVDANIKAGPTVITGRRGRGHDFFVFGIARWQCLGTSEGRERQNAARKKSDKETGQGLHEGAFLRERWTRQGAKPPADSSKRLASFRRRSACAFARRARCLRRVRAIIRGAHAPRVLATPNAFGVAHFRSAGFGKLRFGESPKPAREARALPRT
jgi:hypothetical protein